MKATTFLFAALLLAPAAHAGVVYALDDGTRDNSAAASHSAGVLKWANHFTVAAGGQTIENIAVFWYADSFSSGSPVSVYLWGDPNQDGNPSDSYVIASAAGVSGSGWTTYALPPQSYAGQAGDSFFVGVIAAHPGGEYPAAFDTTTPQGQSWIDFTGTWQNLTQFSNANGNWMVRANYTETGAVPEPSTYALCAAGIALLALKRRRSAR